MYSFVFGCRDGWHCGPDQAHDNERILEDVLIVIDPFQQNAFFVLDRRAHWRRQLHN